MTSSSESKPERSPLTAFDKVILWLYKNPNQNHLKEIVKGTGLTKTEVEDSLWMAQLLGFVKR